MNQMLFRSLEKEWRQRKIQLQTRNSTSLANWIFEQFGIIEALIYGLSEEINSPESYWKHWGALTILLKLVKQEIQASGLRSFHLYFEEIHTLFGTCWAFNTTLNKEQLRILETCIVSIHTHFIAFVQGEEYCDIGIISETLDEATKEIGALYMQVSNFPK